MSAFPLIILRKHEYNGWFITEIYNVKELPVNDPFHIVSTTAVSPREALRNVLNIVNKEQYSEKLHN